MLARAVTFALVGLEPRRVEVEAHIQGGTPSLTIVGLADRAVARTIAALAESEAVLPEHVAETLAYRAPAERLA